VCTLQKFIFGSLSDININYKKLFFKTTHIQFIIYKYLFIRDVHNVAQRKPREGSLFRQEGYVKNS